MHKSQKLSQERVTLPIIVGPLTAGPVSLEAVSVREYLKNPDTAVFRYIHSNGVQEAAKLDPWQLRADLLAWPLEAWEGFFYMAGTFGGARITKYDFAEWQSLVRRALTTPANEWKGLAGEFDSGKVSKLLGPLQISYDWDTQPPQSILLSLTALGSIIATVQLDKLQNVQFKICARPDCRNPPFRATSQKKLHCCYDCSHLMAVRKSRMRTAKKVSGIPAKKSTRK